MPLTSPGEADQSTAEVPFRGLQPSYITVERISGFVAAVLFATMALAAWLVITLALFSWTDFRCWLIGLTLVIFALLLTVFSWYEPLWRWQSTRWRETKNGFELQRGYLWWHHIFVPRERIQHTDVVQGPLMRKFGLATLVIHTAGTHDHSISIDGLSLEEAQSLRKSLLPTLSNSFRIVCSNESAGNHSHQEDADTSSSTNRSHETYQLQDEDVSRNSIVSIEPDTDADTLVK
jgi:membrane protein YdbS with pleckstrin-like domain